MTRSPNPVQLRRLALSHQGLAGRRKIGTGLAGAQKALEQLGYVQIDTISVVARAHHHTFFTRVSKYHEAILNRLVSRRRAFEYWCHAASYLPMRDYRFALPMMRAAARGEMRWMRSRDRKLMAWVKDRIRAEGPLFARDFERPRRGSARGDPSQAENPRRGSARGDPSQIDRSARGSSAQAENPRHEGWWDWKPAKRALEQLFMEGELMSVERQGFQKRYELAERFLPADVDTTEPSLREHADHVIDTMLTAHGFATDRTVAYFRRDARVRSAARQRLAERVREGDLVRRRTAAGEPIYARPDAFDRTLRQLPDMVRILSPFDNVVIQRQRCLAVFGFDYTIECYLPAEKRRFGYFALPILFRECFAGRMDCKAHRPEGRFEIKTLFLEDDVPDAFLPAFASAVGEYAAFTGCPAVEVGTVSPPALGDPIRRSFKQARSGSVHLALHKVQDTEDRKTSPPP